MTLDTSIPVSGITYNGVDMELVSGISEVATADEMNALLVEASIGKTYKFVGTTDDTYTNGDIYVVEEVNNVVLTFSGGGIDTQYSYVVINGVNYYGNSGALEVLQGTEVVCYAKSTGQQAAYIMVGEEQVATGSSISYTYTATENVLVNISQFAGMGFGYISIQPN